MYGGLIIHAKYRLDLPIEYRNQVTSGYHIQGRENGKYWVPPNPSHQVFVPQRDKTLNLYLEGSCDLDLMGQNLIQVDYSTAEFNHVEKLNHFVLQKTPGTYAVAINTQSTHGHLSLFSNGVPIYSTLVIVPGGTLYLWTTEDLETFINSVRREYQLKETLIYRFPTIVNTVVFLNVQSTCSKWYKWSKIEGFEILRRCCAFEQLIFRRLNLDTRSRSEVSVYQESIS